LGGLPHKRGLHFLGMGVGRFNLRLPVKVTLNRRVVATGFVGRTSAGHSHHQENADDHELHDAASFFFAA
jgi:hypothetical protein